MSYRSFVEKLLLIAIIVLLRKISTNNGQYVCNTKSLCDSNAGNTVCDSTCNNLNCSYDSGDCLLQSQPWSGCSQASRCETSFYNDTCDSVCNNEVCLYDNFRCKTSFTDDCIATCLEKWGNGACDTDCNKVQCGYDGNDCSVSGGSVVTGYLYVYAKSVIPIPSNSARFIGITLSLATRTLMFLKMSSKYNGTIPEVESLGDAGIRILYEVQNVPNCNSNTYSVCWGSIENVVRFSSAAGVLLNQFLHSIGVNVTITKVLACQSSFYGEDCSIPCSSNCKSGCNTFDGTCIDGCVGNYLGDTCQSLCSPNCKHGCSTGTTCINGECNAGFTGSECNTACSQGTYGSNCALNCNSGCQGNFCDAVDGTCSCINGFNGSKCEFECSDGTYGIGCVFACGNCLFGAPCDRANGTCLDGCNPGYYGNFCKNACPRMTYGTNCALNCSSNCVNSSCFGANGNCIHGCISGWFGSQCSTNVTTIVYDGTTATTKIAVAIVIVVGVLIGSFAILLIVMIKRSRKNNYQTKLDTKIVIGEGKAEEENGSLHSSDTEDSVQKDDKEKEENKKVKTTEL